MYASPMFAKVLLQVHTSRLWSTAMCIQTDYDPLDPDLRIIKDWMPCPPLSIVVFAATLVSNIFFLRVHS